MNRRVASLLLFGAPLLWPFAAAAEDYPTRPIRLIVPFPAGGYTIGMNSAGALSIIPFMMNKMPFDWQKDLALLTLVARVPEVLVVNPSLKVETLKDMVDYARANPGKLNFGSSGTGSIAHMAVELLKTEA